MKKRSWGDQSVGLEYWQPEANLSQDKLTSYWERQCLGAIKTAKKPGNQKDPKISEIDFLASEGNQCRQKPKEINSSFY